MQKADYFLQSLKQKTDALVASDEKLQQFLSWVRQKSISVKVPCKLAAVRAMYLALALDSDLENDFDIARVLDLGFDVDTIYDLDLGLTLDIDLARVLDLVCNVEAPYKVDLDYDLDIPDDIDIPLTIDYGYDIEIAHALNSVRNINLDRELYQSFQQLTDQLPASKKDEKRIKEWLVANGQAWTEKLRAVMIKHRNIGHDWQFSEEQKKLLQQYYDANKLLVDCLNSDCEVTAEVRQEIEDTLLLPIAEIEKRKGLR
jgi:predicted NACHT family NTPase